MRRISKVLNYVIVSAVIIATVILIITSVIVRDVAFIKHHPMSFLLELFFMSVVSSLIICLVFARTRNVKVRDSITWFFALVAKFAIFHVLFQLSGVYTVMFSEPILI